jgi:hypothetical protein
MDKNLFTVGGVSCLNGRYKVRFTHDLSYVKGLMGAGNTDIELVDAGKPLTKGEMVKFLMTTDLYKTPKYQEAIDAADVKYNQTDIVKVKGKRGRPAKTETAAVTTEAQAEAV